MMLAAARRSVMTSEICGSKPIDDYLIRLAQKMPQPLKDVQTFKVALPSPRGFKVHSEFPSNATSSVDTENDKRRGKGISISTF